MDLSSELNAIDAKAISAMGAPFQASMYEALKAGWLKGQAVLRHYPELQGALEAPSKGGRPRKDEPRPVSFNTVADECGRSPNSLRKWVMMALEVPGDETVFRDWAREKIQALFDRETNKLLAVDDGTDRDEQRKRKQRNLAVLNAVKERVMQDQATEDDVRYLLDSVGYLLDVLHQIEKLYHDGNFDLLLSQVQTGIAKFEGKA